VALVSSFEFARVSIYQKNTFCRQNSFCHLNTLLVNKNVLNSLKLVWQFYYPMNRQDFVFICIVQMQARFFLSPLWWHVLPSHACTEAYLTGWHNVQPQGRD